MQTKPSRKNAVILMDCMSTLQAIESNKTVPQSQICSFRNCPNHTESSFDGSLKLVAYQATTKQINLPKMDASNHRTNQASTSYNKAKKDALLKLAHQKNWQHKREAHRCSPIMQLSRREATIIFRLVTAN